MRIVLALSLVIALLSGCAAATESPTVPEAPATLPPTASAPATPELDVPDSTHTEDFPESCMNARFTADGIDMKDATTGLTWIATDVAYFPGQFPTPTSACAFDGAGFRAATTAEVLALAAAIPNCSLPGLMHAVYAWAPGAKAKGPLPITTSDGCVDVKAGVSYAGACRVWADADVSRSTLCVK